MTTTLTDSAAGTPPNTLDQSARPSSRREGGRRVKHPAAPRSAPALTIVTVVYNGREQLAESIASVLALKREDVEYIVVDGGSTDQTIEFLESLGENLEYWVSEPDRGIYNAMNKALNFVVNESYVLFLGAGDKILKLPELVYTAAAANSGIDVLFGDVLIGDWLFQSSFNPRLRYRNTLHHQGLFIRRGLLIEPWFDESLKVFADWDLNLGLFQRGVSARRLNYTIAYAEPDGVSAKLHLSEIARMLHKRCGFMTAIAAVIYHGGLHLVRHHASILRRNRR